MRRYLTTVDSGYLPRLKVLVGSMRVHCKPFRLAVLAWGRDAIEWCARQPDVDVTPLALFYLHHPEYLPSNLPGPPRERIDEVLCTARWKYAEDAVEQLGSVTMLDADLMFWSSPEAVLDDVRGAPWAVLPHGFPRAAAGHLGVSWETHRKFGLYNGGWVYFNDAAPARAMAKLTWEWCYAGFRKWPDGRETYGDQGQIEVAMVDHPAQQFLSPATCPGPWNVHAHEVARVGGRMHFDGEPLVAYHYQSMRLQGSQVEFGDAGYELTLRQLELLYYPYLVALRSAEGA